MEEISTSGDETEIQSVAEEEKSEEETDEDYDVDLNSITTFEMAYKHYNRLWKDVQNKLEHLINMESLYEPLVFPTRIKALRFTSKLYLRYIGVANGIVKCYEHIPHPQKRQLIRKLCDSCIGRTLELKRELVALENSEFHYLDPMLLELRMLPSNMDIKIPEYLRKEQAEEQRVNKEFAKQALEVLRDEENRKHAVSKKKKLVKMAMVTIRLLQAHERARQARDNFRDLQKKYIHKEIAKRKEIWKDKEINITRKAAASVIQRTWRAHMFQRHINSEYSEQLGVLGMLPSFEKNTIRDEIEKDRLDVIERNEREYSETKERIRQEYLTYKVIEMGEELEKKIRSYFHGYKEIFGQFPEFPEDNEGGSDAMFKISIDKDVVDKMREEERLAEEAKSTKSGKDDKSSKSGKDDKSSKAEEEPEIIGYVLTPSKFLPDIVALHEEYKRVWKHKKVTNFDRFDAKMTEEEVQKEIKYEVRLAIDEKMREELLRLRTALEKDTKKKPKKKSKKKEKKAKKGKKKEVDLTPQRTTESLIEELVSQGIIVDYPKYSLEEFWGDYNFSGHLQQMSGDPENDPFPCLLDVRRVVNEYCILPMGSQTVHSKGAYIKSILFAGPRGVGKKSLVYAICNEIGATMMDLSAENIDSKYPGDDGKSMLLHLVTKVGRLLQPTVILIRDAENYFYKKIPASCTLENPGRLKKDFPKLLKNIGDEDRILMCGTTVLPFDVDLRAFGISFAKVTLILKPDYNCRRSLWRKYILKNGGTITKELDTTVLCNISEGFTAGSIKNVVEQTLTKPRLTHQDKIPLSVGDFVRELATQVPVYDEEIVAYKSWLDKMPLRKKRAALLQEEKEEAGEVEEDSSEEEH